MFSLSRTKDQGFTLIEMAIVLVIVGIVISTIATVLPSLIASAKVKKTKAVLEKIDFTVRGYVTASGRLPCPDTTGDGWENRNDNGTPGSPIDDTCVSYSGTLPFLTLGMSAANDSWNNVVKYGVYEELVRTTPETGSNPICTVLATLINASVPLNPLRLYTRDPGNVDSNKAYVIVSGGPRNLDGNGDGFFDGYNEGNDIGFDHPDRAPDHVTAGSQYDDLMVVISLSYLSGANCTGGGGGVGGGVASETNCTDGIDNDFDGWVDCADPDCVADPACAGDPPVQINSTAMPSTVIGNSYTHTFNATGGNGEYDWSLVSSDVPGLTINRLTGVLSGEINVCNSATPYAIEVKVVDRADSTKSDTRSFDLIVDAGTLTIVPTYETGDSAGTETFVCGGSTFSRILTANGPAQGSFDWDLSWSSPSPTGFAISQQSSTEGRLQKTGIVGVAQSYIATFTATDSACVDNTAQLNLTVQVLSGGTGAPYSAGLTGEYWLDECSLTGSAGDVVDASGNGNDGTSTAGTLTIGSGKQCRAGLFTSGPDSVSLPNVVLDNVADFTFAVWMKSGDAAQKAIISGANSTNNNEFLMFLASSTSVGVFLHDARYSFTVPPLDDNAWHHLVWKREGTTETLYVDGASVGTTTRATNPLSIDVDGLWLGAEQDSVGGGWDPSQEFVGLLDEAMFWGKALTDSEVTTIYTLNRGTCSGTCYADAVARYSMENFPWNGTAGEVKDTGVTPEENGVSSQRGTGVLASQTSSSVGKVCRSGLFTRVDSTNGGYLDFGDPAPLDPGTSPWTISVWLNWDGTATAENIIYNKETLYEARVTNGYVQYAWQPHWAWDGGTSFSVTANNWYHMTLVYDGRQQMMYKNGQLVYARDQTGSIGSNGNKFLIGGRGSSTPRNLFGGMIDELYLFDRALSESEIKQVYTTTATCADTVLIITKTALSDGVVGSGVDGYVDYLTAVGGDLPYFWEVLGSSVGTMRITDQTTGEMTGTIEVGAGDYTITVRVTGSNGLTDTKVLPITVN